MITGIGMERALVSAKLIVCGHILNPLWWPAERRRARRAEVFGDTVSDYLKKHYLTASEPELDSDSQPERIFSIWFQGEENAPQLVKNCFASIRTHIKGLELVVLDEESLKDWISLPQEIMDKFTDGKIGYAHFSDICRVELLHRYGGYWIDATAFVTEDIPDFIRDSEFFVYRAGHRIRGYYSFIQNCFIHAHRGSYLLEAWRAMILAYWKAENSRVDYFQHQLMFKVLVQNDKRAEELFASMPEYEQDMLHSLWYIHGTEKADPARLGELTGKEWFFQKTSFKEVNKVVPGSWRDYILNWKPDPEKHEETSKSTIES